MNLVCSSGTRHNYLGRYRSSNDPDCPPAWRCEGGRWTWSRRRVHPGPPFSRSCPRTPAPPPCPCSQTAPFRNLLVRIRHRIQTRHLNSKKGWQIFKNGYIHWWTVWFWIIVNKICRSNSEEFNIKIEQMLLSWPKSWLWTEIICLAEYDHFHIP